MIANLGRLRLPRLRVRFGLRTLFVAVTVFSLWLGWQSKIVQARREAIQVARDSGAVVIDFSAPPYSEIYSQYPPEIPFWRRWLGDAEIAAIVIDDELAIKRLTRLLPEALVGPGGRPMCGFEFIEDLDREVDADDPIPEPQNANAGSNVPPGTRPGVD